MKTWRWLILSYLLINSSLSSELGAMIGDGAASQLLRHAAQLLLSEPRYIDIILTSRENPGLSPLASLDMNSMIGYRNLSLHFKDRAITLRVEQLKLRSSANVTHLLWPLNLGEHQLDMDLEMPRGEMNMIIGEDTMSLQDCYMLDPKFEGSIGGEWFVERVISFFTSIFSPSLDSTLCSILHHYLNEIPHSNIMRFPMHSLLPAKAREFLAHNETNLFYRLNSVDIHEHQMTVRATIEWNQEEEEGEDPFMASNRSEFEIELKGDDRVTVWIEDTVLNELINQIEWDFEWMTEKVPVTSPIIPPDSKGFLSTLCIDCYFLLNVSARGNPTIQATNESLVFEKRDRVNLRVVNPDRNVTSVFASFVLTIQAQLQPSFDDGILRTLVQLLDTKIVMEDGAFPKAWRFYMEDLMRGMILDMLWPEIKKAIEEISYGKGLKVSPHCGFDPKLSEIDIGEGSFAITTRLALQDLEIERCLTEMKSAIPNTRKLFQKLDPTQ